MPYPTDNWSSATIPPVIKYQAKKYPPLQNPNWNPNSPPIIVNRSSQPYSYPPIKGFGGRLHKKKGTKRLYKKKGGSKKHHKKHRRTQRRH